MVSTGLRQLSLQFGNSGVTGIRNLRTRGSLSGSNLCSVSMNLRTRGIFRGSSLRSVSMKQNSWNANIADRFLKRGYELPCKGMCSQNSGPFADTDFVVTLLNLARSAVERWQRTIFMVKVASVIGLIVFLTWGVDPVVRLSRSMCGNTIYSNFTRQENEAMEQDNKFYNGATLFLRTFSYLVWVLLWVLVFLACRDLGQMLPTTEAGKIVKILLRFVERASAGLTLDCCLSRLTLGSKFKSTNDVDTGRTGFSYADNLGRCVVYSAVVLSLCELTGVVTIDVGIKMFLAASMLVCGIAEDRANYRSISMYKAPPRVVNEKDQN